MTTTDWIGGSGDWSDASNWSAGVPNDSSVEADLSGTNAYTATIAGGESFTVGTLNITDANAVLDLEGALTVANSLNLNAGTLTAGANAVLQGTSSSAGIFNNATIAANTAGGSFQILSAAFTNAGTFDIGNSDTAFINTASFSNTGVINVTGGGRLFLQGNLSTPDLGNIVANGGQLVIAGMLDNTGYVLKVGGSNPLGTVRLDGTITGGTIVDAGNGMTFNFGDLDGVKYEGALTVGNAAFLRIYDGLNVTGPSGTGRGTINISSGELDFYGTQSIGNATITIGSAPNTAGALETLSNGAASTLTFAAGLTLIAKGRGSLIEGDGKLLNRGTIIAEAANGTVYLMPQAVTNAGAIIVANGDLLQIVAPLANTGAAEVISGTLELYDPVTGTGSIQIDSSGVLYVKQSMAAGQRVVFYKTGGALEIGASSAFKASISGFGSGRFLDLRDVGFGSGTKVSYSGTTTGGTLTVSDGTHTANLKLVGNFTGGTFSDKADDIGGTIVTFSGSGSAVAQSRLHRFVSAVAVHSADKAGFAGVHAPMADEAASRTVLAAAHH